MNRENDEQKLHMKEQNDKLKNDNLHFLEDFRKEMQQIQTMERERWREMQKDFERQIQLKTEIIDDFKHNKALKCVAQNVMEI